LLEQIVVCLAQLVLLFVGCGLTAGETATCAGGESLPWRCTAPQLAYVLQPAAETTEEIL
jgi:hypothetical protein